MKNKIAKFWGVGLVFVIIASLLVGVMPVSADVLSWDTVATPKIKGNVLVDATDVEIVAFAPDGQTIFAYDNDATKLYKSTNGGATWSTDDDWELNGTAAIVAMSVSSDYDDDNTIVAATADTVYRSNDGGKDWGEIGTAQLQAWLDTSGDDVPDADITSVAVGDHYRSGIAIIVGASDGAYGGGMLRYTTGSLEWEDMKVTYEEAAAVEPAFGTEVDVQAVAFSPNHTSDAIYIAVVTGNDGVGDNTYVVNKHSTMKWNASISTAEIAGLTAEAAVVAFPDDYNGAGESDNIIFVATSGADDADDVYRIEGRAIGSASKKYDLDVDGDDTSTDVVSIAIKGDYDDAEMIAMYDDAETVRTEDVTDNNPDWDNVADVTGEDGVAVYYPGDEDVAYALTNGVGGAFSVSEDSGERFDQISLINVTVAANLTINSAAFVTEDLIYIILDDAGQGSVYKTTDGGDSWTRILYKAGLVKIAVSPEYADDETLYVTTAGTTMWRSTNGGVKFSGVAAQEDVTAIYLIDGNDYYTGHAGGKFYEKGSWSSAEDLTGTVKSIVVADDGTIFVGNDDGTVYMSEDDGDSFDKVGDSEDIGDTGNVYIALDADYENNNYIYATSDVNTDGVFRWEIGASKSWKELDTGGAFEAAGLSMSSDGSLYAADKAAGVGVYRSVNPGAKTPEFDAIADDLDAAAEFKGLYVMPGTNDLMGIVAGVDAGTTYGYAERIITFTDPLAVAPELSSPKDASVTGTKVTLTWKDLSDKVDDYTVEVSTDADFDNIIQDSADISGTAFTTDELDAGTQYYWRVYVNDDPYDSKKSAVWTFTPELAAPELKSPDYGDDEVLQNPTFSWLAVGGASSYELELADNAFFANSVVKKPLTHTTWTWDETLEYGTTYYWRVRAVKSGSGILTNTGPWAESVFTVAATPVEAAAPVVVEQAEAPVIELTVPPTEVTYEQTSVTPAYIWAIVIIGAILVIAVIILIVRTRRVS